MVERLDEWVQSMTVTEAVHNSVRLKFAFMCGDTGELFGEAFSYGGLFSAGF